MKLIVLVMSCEVDRYPELVKKQQETWDSLPHDHVQTIYYYSGTTPELIGDRLTVAIEEGEGYFYIKTLEAFKYLLTKDWDYIFKTDNSSYINKDQLYQVLYSKPRTQFYGGHVYLPNYTKAEPFMWGEGFALSRDVVQHLVNIYDVDTYTKLGVEDVHIGLLLKDLEWDVTMLIHRFYGNKDFKVSHAYRCKNDCVGAIKFDDEIKAMETIHKYITNGQANSSISI